MSRLAVAGLAAACCLWVALGSAWPAVAAARPVGDCTTTTGATLIVDFKPWGGPVLRACGSTPTTGWRLLNQGGWATAGDAHDGPGFICRISYAGFRHGAFYPTAAKQACVDTPPGNAYWAYWMAGPGQNTWHYSQEGAASYHPQPGSISLWAFGGTSITGTSGSARPKVSPDELRREVAAASPALTSAPPAVPPAGNGGSAGPTVLVLLVVAMLAVAAAAGTWRRRTRARALG